MTLNVNEPTDQRLVSELASYVREDRVEINTISSGQDSITISTLLVSAGDIALAIGTDLSADKIESVLISGTGASIIEYIRGGTEGQIKIFIFQDNDISFRDGVKLDGKIYLNHLPALSVFNAQQDDILAIMNIGGDGALVYGYWKELWKQVSVK